MNKKYPFLYYVFRIATLGILILLVFAVKDHLSPDYALRNANVTLEMKRALQNPSDTSIVWYITSDGNLKNTKQEAGEQNSDQKIDDKLKENKQDNSKKKKKNKNNESNKEKDKSNKAEKKNEVSIIEYIPNRGLSEIERNETSIYKVYDVELSKKSVEEIQEIVSDYENRFVTKWSTDTLMIVYFGLAFAFIAITITVYKRGWHRLVSEIATDLLFLFFIIILYEVPVDLNGSHNKAWLLAIPYYAFRVAALIVSWKPYSNRGLDRIERGIQNDIDRAANRMDRADNLKDFSRAEQDYNWAKENLRDFQDYVNEHEEE